MDHLEYEKQFAELVHRARLARSQYDSAPENTRLSKLEEITNIKNELLELTRNRKLFTTESLYRARLPDNEQARLKELRRLKVLDSPFETLFDDIVKLTAHICDAPISIISLIDEHRQWFKAAIGVPDATETHRDVAFSAHTILTNDILEVPDATQDVRFADNPLVLANPDIVFYAGAPITMPMGENIGALCVMDHKVNYLTEYQKTSLAYLAKIVAKALTIRNNNIPKVPE